MQLIERGMAQQSLQTANMEQLLTKNIVFVNAYVVNITTGGNQIDTDTLI